VLARILTAVFVAVPFAWLAVLACFARSGHGSFRISFRLSNILLNFTSALSGETGASFLSAYATTFALSGAGALITCSIAIPLGRRLAELSTGIAQQLTGLFIASRLIPITAALPILTGVLARLDVPYGVFSTLAIYVALFLPLAAACLSSADWAEVRRANVLLGLDAAVSRKQHFLLLVRSIGGDIVVAALLVFLFTWSEFFIAMSALPPEIMTLAKHFANFETINGYLWGPLAASLVLCLMPIVIAAAVVEGIMAARAQRMVS
jgi:multiple sugar transport system permease protein